jgi:hypothetical protein
LKIFVFSPYDWHYCGGALVVVAEDYDAAIALLRASNEYDVWDACFASCKAEAKSYGEASGWKGSWLLGYSAPVEDTTARVVLVDYNYA